MLCYVMLCYVMLCYGIHVTLRYVVRPLVICRCNSTIMHPATVAALHKIYEIWELSTHTGHILNLTFHTSALQMSLTLLICNWNTRVMFKLITVDLAKCDFLMFYPPYFIYIMGSLINSSCARYKYNTGKHRVWPIYVGNYRK